MRRRVALVARVVGAVATKGKRRRRRRRRRQRNQFGGRVDIVGRAAVLSKATIQSRKTRSMRSQKSPEMRSGFTRQMPPQELSSKPPFSFGRKNNTFHRTRVLRPEFARIAAAPKKQTWCRWDLNAGMNRVRFENRWRWVRCCGVKRECKA